jgi:molybdopterin synthase catalytic subunit
MPRRGGRLAALELEHYPGMAEAEIARIAAEAAGTLAIVALTVIHRHGRIEPGGNIVLVVAASSHRQAAFDAASFMMDFLKTRAPFWKKEHRRRRPRGCLGRRTRRRRPANATLDGYRQLTKSADVPQR